MFLFLFTITKLQRKNVVFNDAKQVLIATQKVLLAVFFVYAVRYFCYATKNQKCRQRIFFTV